MAQLSTSGILPSSSSRFRTANLTYYLYIYDNFFPSCSFQTSYRGAVTGSSGRKVFLDKSLVTISPQQGSISGFLMANSKSDGVNYSLESLNKSLQM
jgi:hypothetical protein